MAIRQFEFTVSKSGITPATEQRVSIQTEHAAAELSFKLDKDLFTELSKEKESGRAVYRFDCYDSVGGSVKTESRELTENVITLTVGESITRHGGKVAVYLVITIINTDGTTRVEFLSAPARLRIERIPDAVSDNGDSKESISTIFEVTKKYASEVEEARDQTVAAQRELEEGSEFYFDGNLVGEVDFVIDSEMSAHSTNAVQNKAIKAYVDNAMKAAMLAAHPVGSLYYSVASTEPSLLFGGTWKRIKDVFILAAGDTYTVGAEGGEATHTLTTTEMPSHAHKDGTASQYDSSGNIQGINAPTDGGASAIVYWSEDLGKTTTYVGGDQPHNNMPPYKVFYCWQRTA